MSGEFITVREEKHLEVGTMIFQSPFADGWSKPKRDSLSYKGFLKVCPFSVTQCGQWHRGSAGTCKQGQGT